VSEVLPAPDPAKIAATPPKAVELVTLSAGTRLLRIHPLGGGHPIQWNEFRSWGPTGSRFDHHIPPAHIQGRAIAYLTYGDEAFTAAVAEYFQDASGAGVAPINSVLKAPNMSVFELGSDLTVLDLDGGWITRARGNQAIRTGSRSRSRQWSREIYAHHTGVIQGLAYSSSIWGPGNCVALWETALPAIPQRPIASRQLSDAAMDRYLDDAAKALQTYIL